MYGVISSKTRKIKKLYGAISSKTRKIKKVYGVVGGVTRLIWKSGTDVKYPLVWIENGSINTSCQFPLSLRSENGGSSDDYGAFWVYNGSSRAYRVYFPKVDGCFDYIIGRTITVTWSSDMYSALNGDYFYRWLYGPVSANENRSGLVSSFYVGIDNSNLYVEDDMYLHSNGSMGIVKMVLS